MTVREYNTVFLPKNDRARGFLYRLEHAMQKTNDYEGCMKQLEIIGWSAELRETIEQALEFYRMSVVKNEVVSTK